MEGMNKAAADQCFLVRLGKAKYRWISTWRGRQKYQQISTWKGGLLLSMPKK
jgi:hypothetical protein